MILSKQLTRYVCFDLFFLVDISDTELRIFRFHMRASALMQTSSFNICNESHSKVSFLLIGIDSQKKKKNAHIYFATCKNRLFDDRIAIS